MPGAPTQPALSLHDVHVRQGAQPVLHGIGGEVPSGRWTCIVGPNGAGKSTLLKAMAGLLPLASGRIDLLGQPMAGIAARERAQRMAWLGQGERAADELSAFDAVMLGRMPHQNWLASVRDADMRIVMQTMQATHTWHLRARALAHLSGGERQRVLLARALAVQAPIVLMDEPLANLDPPHQSQWLQDMRALVQAGTTLVSVLHEIPMALQADLIWVMAQGRLLHRGPSNSSETRAAIEAVFDHRIAVRPVVGMAMWTTVPVER